jgi:hypothetical protein
LIVKSSFTTILSPNLLYMPKMAKDNLPITKDHWYLLWVWSVNL